MSLFIVQILKYACCADHLTFGTCLPAAAASAAAVNAPSVPDNTWPRVRKPLTEAARAVYLSRKLF